MSELESYKAMHENPFETLIRRVKCWNDAKIIFCEKTKLEVGNSPYEAKLESRKTIHQFKDSVGHVFKLFNWHKDDPLPDS